MPEPGSEPRVPPGPRDDDATREVHGASHVTVQVVAPEKPAGPPPRKGAWERFVQALPLVQAIVIALVGYLLTGSVTNAIQRRQLELANVKEMQTLLAKLYERQSPGDLAATVAALTAFREYAVPPLTGLLQSAEPNQRTAGESGLRTLALSDSAAVASELLRIVRSRNRICSWRMTLSAVRLLADLGCRDAVPPMRELLARISGANRDSAAVALAAISNPDAPPDAANTDELESALEDAVARLAPPAPGGSRP